MPWPTPQDYNEAIQSPRLSFDDPELKTGTPETTSLGLPRPITGGFASVYRMHCGQRDWAVRCFLREFTDQQQRYGAISKHLSAAKLPYTVSFDFLPQGIRIRGQWYPILKMEWVRGELLNEYIRKHLGNSALLLDLANRWSLMIKALQAAGVAHGDLQHGNVVVVNGDFRLIDYDGMYVPALSGQASHEVGHRNYQHPQRTEFDFGPTTDNFSAWVIYVSMLALSIDPSLWHRVKGGDEYLLFRREDFAEPFSSDTFTLLSRHSDQRIETLTSFFQSLLYSSPDQLPPLDGQKGLYTSSPPGIATSSLGSKSGTTSGKPAWLIDNEAKTQSVGTTVNIAGPSDTQNSAWVLDFITPLPTADRRSLETNNFAPRLVLGVAFGASGLLIAGSIFLLLPFAVTVVLIVVIAMITSVLLRDMYRRDPVVVAMLKVVERQKKEKNLLNISQQSIKEYESQKSSALSDEKRRLKDIESRRRALQDKERREKGQVQVRLDQYVKSTNERRMILNRDEAAALKQIQDRNGVEVANLNRRIAALSQIETAELSKALRTLQAQALNDHLRSHSIVSASIPGIGEKLKSRLRYSGITTAADIEFGRVKQVDGIGDNKAAALVVWQRWVESYARIPSSLSQIETANIRAKYQAQKQQLETQRDAAQQQLMNNVNAVKARIASDKRAIDVEQAKTQAKAQQDIQEVADRYLPEYATLTQEQARLTTEYAEQCNKIDELIPRVRKQMGDYYWQLAKTRRDLLSFKDVSFKVYIRSVLPRRWIP